MNPYGVTSAYPLLNGRLQFNSERGYRYRIRVGYEELVSKPYIQTNTSIN